MFSFRLFRSNPGSKYIPLSKEEEESDEQSLLQPRPRQHQLYMFSFGLATISAVLLITTGIVLTWAHILSQTSCSVTSLPPLSQKPCTEPSLRREWRTLSLADRSSYISAVQCLYRKPSRVGHSHNRWDDFPYTHVRHTGDAHNGFGFLAYHRWFIHLYETALRSECGYQGHLVYWDWTMDWEFPYSADIFDPDTGFGGDGDPHKPGYIGNCIKDGPFKGYMTSFENELRAPHCLSRKFPKGREFEYWHEKWRPEELDAVLKIDDWAEFNDKVEAGMHLAMPYLMGGDLKTFGSPADPLFFLHHTQLDRIYWMWQQRRPQARIASLLERLHSSQTNISNDLSFEGLGSVTTISDTIDIQGGKLCYRY